MTVQTITASPALLLGMGLVAMAGPVGLVVALREQGWRVPRLHRRGRGRRR